MSEIEYFEAKTYIHDVVKTELFKSSGAAIAYVEGVFNAHVARARELAAQDRYGLRFTIEDDALAKTDPASWFHRKVVWAEDVANQPGYVRWHKDYFYVTRKVLTLRDDPDPWRTPENLVRMAQGLGPEVSLIASGRCLSVDPFDPEP